MTVVVVRVVDTRELVGFFWGGKEVIWDGVDAVTDPSLCEYARLPQGGLEAHEGAPFIPSQFEEGDGYLLSLTPSETTVGALDRPLQWRRFDTADVGVGLIARLLGQGRGD